MDDLYVQQYICMLFAVCICRDPGPWLKRIEMNENRLNFSHPENPPWIFVITWKWFLLSFRLLLENDMILTRIKKKMMGLAVSLCLLNIEIFFVYNVKQRCIQTHITSDTSHHILDGNSSLFWQFFSLFIPSPASLVSSFNYYNTFHNPFIFIEKMVFLI